MAYRLQKDEPLAAGLKRAAEEQVTGAIRSLQSDNLDQGVYDARRCLKKVRSLLRLLAAPLGPIYVQENQRLRDVARRFADLRDTQVSLELLDRLAERYRRKSTLSRQRQALAARHSVIERDTNWQLLLAETIDALTATRRRIEDWPLRDLSGAALEAEIRKTRKRSRQALERAQRTRSAEDFHELRKSVKRELNQLRLLNGGEAELKRLKHLSDLLGDHHNLAVLLFNLEDYSKRFQAMVGRQLRQLENQIGEAATLQYEQRREVAVA